ncbi:inter-alpha-trypsin inhibitor heavy chain H3-like [Mizuhopecten yessoensis]|uniref:inter-alpha-trypsin inhibitor heavy chain H3-like n=1 Tax=Mizuhopecten yessoensis TaxID=6573 RepID=UPI000B458273|nr:inter-alpha-trypsin inhibitor heavy chain H3-like [Mizuhopecten yessoensis]
MDIPLQLVLTIMLVSVVVKSRAQIHQAPRIYHLHVHSEVKMRFASTLVTSKVANPGGEPREATFDVTLPKEAFITSFLMEIGGKIYPGDVKEKEAALKQYQKAKQTGQSAGHIRRRPRETNQFQVSVNVAAESKVTFNLTYQELLKRTFSYYENVIFIDPGQIVDDMRVFVIVKESRPIIKFRVPSVSNDIPNSVDTPVGEENVTIGYPDQNTAYALFEPDVAEQRRRSEQGISGKFIVRYEIERQSDSGDVLVVDGYFVHFFAPTGIEPMPKDVVFLLDVSGSMQGRKLKQMQDAMGRILDDLGENDRFNIQLFSNTVKAFRYILQNVTAENIMEAKKYIKNARADGGTDIDYGLARALNVLRKARDNSSRTQILVFLTDGDATSGVTGEGSILNNLKSRNTISVPIFCLAFGKDANFNLCKSTSLENFAVARRIYEDADASLQISGFYDEVSISLLKNVSFQYLGDAARNGNITTSDFNTYYAGSELVVAGQLENRNATSIDIEITGLGTNGAVDFLTTVNSIELNLPPSTDIIIEDDVTLEHGDSGPGSEDIAKISDLDPTVARSITEKMWAYLTIKQLLSKKDATDDKSEIEQLRQRILDLSLKYQFVTPLTSMVVTKPNEEDHLSSFSDSDGSRSQPALPVATPSPRGHLLDR